MKTKTQKIGAFGFPSPKPLLPPSVIERSINSLASVVSFSSGLLLCSLLINVILALIAFQRADVVAFVADGGVFGCQVAVMTEPE